MMTVTSERGSEAIRARHATTQVWDELLLFNLRNLDREEFEQGQIRVNARPRCSRRASKRGGYALPGSW